MPTDESLVRTILILIAAVVLLPLLAMVVMMPMMGLWGGGHMFGGAWTGAGPGWLWFLMSLLPILVLLGFVYLLYSAVREPGARSQDPALEELRAAYARGELSDEEFEKRRERLRNDR